MCESERRNVEELCSFLCHATFRVGVMGLSIHNAITRWNNYDDKNKVIVEWTVKRHTQIKPELMNHKYKRH